MTRLATAPVCPSRFSVQRIVILLNKFLPSSMDARVVGRQEERIKSARCVAPHGRHAVRPLGWNTGRLCIDCHHVATGACMRDIIGLCIQAHRLCTVFRLLEFLDDGWPRSAAHVLQDHNWWTMFFDPAEHAVKCPARLSALIDVLLFIIEIRVVDARCTGDEDVDVTGDKCFGAIGCVAVFLSEGSVRRQGTTQRTHNRPRAHIRPGKGVVVENFAQCTPV